MAQRLRTLLTDKNFSNLEKVTGSFGVASYSKGEEMEDIIQRVDNSLYQAKKRGRNRIETLEL